MGVYASSFHRSGGGVLLESTDPSQADWITAHADACGLTVPAVQRCWGRFLTLQPDSDGNVPSSGFTTGSVISSQLVQQLPVSAGGLLTFQTYCSAVNWLSDSTVETKLRGLYQAMSCCVPLDKEALDRLLTELYPQDAPGDIRQLSGLILREVDTKNQGFIDEDQFTVWLRRLLPETLTSSLHFPALPSKIAVAHEQHRPQRGPIQTEDTTNVTENQLQLTAAEMSRRRRDWRLLANRLGFLEKDCQAFERKHPETENQVLEMLLQWHRRARRTGAARELGEALRASGNTDIDNQVFQLAF